MDFYSQSQAAFEIDAEKPPSRETVQAWHDRVKGPRDSAGRRVYTREIIEKIKAARHSSRRSAMKGRINVADIAAEAGVTRFGSSTKDAIDSFFGEDSE